MASGDDGSVEILVTGTVDASVAAAAKEATATFDAVSAKAAEATQAQASRISAMVDRSIAEMNAKAATAKAVTGTLFDSEGSRATVAAQNAMMGLGASGKLALEEIETKTEEAAAATGGLKIATSGAIQEYIRLGHEALTGNFSRMPGSMIVLASRTGGLASAFAAASPAVLGFGAAALAVVGTVAYLAYQEYETKKATEGMAEAFALSGRAANNSVDAVRGNISALSDMADVSKAVAQELIAFDATHAQVDARISNAANQLIPQFAKAFGEQGVAELNKFKTQLSGVSEGTIPQAIKKFDELNSSILGFKPAQVQLIEGMIQSGDRIGAVNEILAQFAAQGGAHIASVRDQIVQTQNELQNATARASALAEQVKQPADPRLIGAITAAAKIASSEVAGLQGRLRALQSIAAQNSGESLEAAFANSHATLMSLRDSATRAKEAVAELHQEMAQRRAANPNDKEANDYFAHQAKVDADLMHREDPGDFKKPKTTKPKDDVVQQWTEQLHAQEIASNNFFKDNTADELAFWKSKIDIVKAGSKDWLEVQSKIFEAAKSLAHMAYAEQIANDNDKIVADKGNWSAEQADWAEKLAFIKGKLTEQSTEYKNAHREWENAQREHTQAELREQEEAGAKSISALKKQIDDQKRISDETAKISILQIKDKGAETPFGGVEEAKAESDAKMHAIRDEMAGLDQLVAKTISVYDEILAKEKAAGAAGEDAWKKSNQAKIDSLADLAEKQKALQDKMQEQQLAGIAAQKSAYASYISGTVSTTVNGFDKMISGQMTWAKFGISIYQSLVREEEQQIAKAITQHLAGELAKTTATTVGGEARVAATASASSQSAAIVGLHNMKEITSHAAAAAAAAYHAMAGIPIIGPALGAAAAIATFAAVEAFGALASFDVGTNFLPGDMPAMVHRGERIVPAADNAKLIDLTTRGAIGGSGNGNGGDTHNHFSPTIHASGADPRAVMSAIEGNFGDFKRVVGKAMRNGSHKY